MIKIYMEGSALHANCELKKVINLKVVFQLDRDMAQYCKVKREDISGTR